MYVGNSSSNPASSGKSCGGTQTVAGGTSSVSCNEIVTMDCSVNPTHFYKGRRTLEKLNSSPGCCLVTI